MVKSELVLRIADLNPHLRERDIEAVVNAILGRMTGAFIAGDRVELRGFGVFTVKPREARAGRNPKTSAAVPVADKRGLALKAGKLMQARLSASKAPAAPKLEATAERLLRRA